ncbi:hypothetical protein PENSPDRAFT_493009 [Peniophora sp. CONT]|nr:hypothetical protein PENSPDRAFT_493009 [Peniophora sp. CONT]
MHCLHAACAACCTSPSVVVLRSDPFSFTTPHRSTTVQNRLLERVVPHGELRRRLQKLFKGGNSFLGELYRLRRWLEGWEQGSGEVGGEGERGRVPVGHRVTKGSFSCSVVMVERVRAGTGGTGGVAGVGGRCAC